MKTTFSVIVIILMQNSVQVSFLLSYADCSEAWRDMDPVWKHLPVRAERPSDLPTLPPGVPSTSRLYLDHPRGGGAHCSA